MDNSSNQSTKQKIFPWLIVVGCCFMQIAGIGTFLDVCGVFYVPASIALGITVGEYSSYLTWIFVGTAISAVVMSFVIDKVDIRLLIGVNAVICAVALAFMGYYPSMLYRKVAGFLIGFDGGFFFMTMTPILINNWFVKRKGLAMGLAMASSGVGAAILSPLITILIHSIGWQLTYVCVACMVLVMIIPFDVFVFRRNPRELGLKPYGWTPDFEKEIQKQKNTQKAGVPFKRAWKTISYICVCCFVGCIAIFSPFNSHLNAFGQSLGYTALVSSTFLVAVSLGSICEKLVMGLLYDYISIYKIIAINLVLLAAGLFLLSTQTELWCIYIGAFLFGVQNSLVAVQTPLLVRDLFGDRAYEKLIPFTRVGVGVFGLFGPTMITAILSCTGGYSMVWGAGIIIVAVAAVLVFIARQYRTQYSAYWLDENQEEDTAAAHICKAV